MTKVLIPIAEGSEEMEVVITADVLRRAGWDVTLAGLAAGPVRCSRRVQLVPDTFWSDIRPAEFDLLVIPGGGPGVQRLLHDPRVLEAVRAHARAGKRLAAVCAGPLVLQAAGVLDGRRATGHPDVAERLKAARYEAAAIVTDGNITTSQAAGTCFTFALELIRLIEGPEKAATVRKGLVL